MRHTTCYKAFPTYDLYHSNCVKKNCTLPIGIMHKNRAGNVLVAKDDMHLSDTQLKSMLQNRDSQVHPTYHRIDVDGELLRSKDKLMELY